jgi:hypothetical protein
MTDRRPAAPTPHPEPPSDPWARLRDALEVAAAATTRAQAKLDELAEAERLRREARPPPLYATEDH